MLKAMSKGNFRAAGFKMLPTIEQQIYTRARRTMFLQSEGYGTIACSAGLSESFIKESIHPYCVYPTSPALQNYAVCPPAITVAHYPCGKMLLGQAVYVKADFTGQRSAFFAHNYILSPEMVDEVLRDIGRVGDVRFLTETDIADTHVLPTIVEPGLILNTWGSNSQAEQNIEDVNISLCCQWLPVSVMEHTLHCVTASIYSAKKTYVIVPVPPSDMHKYVWNFLTELYKHLPMETKHLLGVCTYAREPRNTKGIHLIFLEKGTAAARFSADYVIDANAMTASSDTAHKNQLVTHSHQLKYSTPHIPPARFFTESEFFHLRIPHNSNALHTREAEWLNANLDRLSQSELKKIPDSFIRRGKIYSGNAEIFVIVGILKSCIDQKNIDIRYLIGSYSLSEYAISRTKKNINRLFGKICR